jgi:molecular chaperone HtpG
MEENNKVNNGDLRFKVNLEGMISLLSNHLYSSPEVYVRELLQNAVDAITARKKVDKTFEGEVHFEIYEAGSDNPPTIVIEDNGIGLTEDEVHQFLSVIGQSSKKEDIISYQNDFIGQFGIGLLSCFIVSDEILLITQSIKGSKSIEWKGRCDGTYSVRELESSNLPGTKIYLRCKPGCEDFFQISMLKDLLIHYGCFLPYPVYLSDIKTKIRINDQKPFSFERDKIQLEDREKVLDYGYKVFDEQFLDYIPLVSQVGDITGFAYIIAHKMNPSVKRKHRVYLKNMFLSDNVENLLPDWAFFAKCVVNIKDLQPTASREELYEDKKLKEAQKELSQCIRNYLIQKAKQDTEMLQSIIYVHGLAIKALAIEDDELYKLFIDWLLFETSMGDLPFGEIRKRTGKIYYTPNVDEFRQIQRISAAKSLCVVNCGYVYDADIIQRIPEFFPGIEVERISPTEISESFANLELSERDQVFDFVNIANVVLQPLGCTALVKKFLPTELPALFIIDEEANFIRNVQNTKEISNELFASVLDKVTSGYNQISRAQLCFNFNNQLINKLINAKDMKLMAMAIENIYIQALLLRHYPLTQTEMKMLNSSLLNLIEYKI